MTCREIAEFLMQYIDGELPWRQRRDFEQHLKLCPACCRYLKSYQLTVRLAQSSKLPIDDWNSERVPDELVRLIVESRSRNS